MYRSLLIQVESNSEWESESDSVEGDSSGEEGGDENRDGEGDENAAVAMSAPTATALGDLDGTYGEHSEHQSG